MKKPIKTNYTPEQIMYVGSHSKEITEGYNDAAKRFLRAFYQSSTWPMKRC